MGGCLCTRRRMTSLHGANVMASFTWFLYPYRTLQVIIISSGLLIINMKIIYQQMG
jgi:hypothetical protein